MKNISFTVLVISTFLTIASPAFALNIPLRKEVRETVKETIKEGKEDGLNRDDIKKEIRENVKGDIKEAKEGLVNKVKDFMKRNLKFEARVKGNIAVIGSGNFTMSSEDGTFQVNIIGSTQLLRRFGGKSTLTEYSVGNEVIVFGKFTDESKSTIDAKIVKNNSIQKRRGTFFGDITVKNTDNFIMQSEGRGNQTVYFGSATFKDRKETLITFSDIKVGDKVRVRGVWDKTLSKITEVEYVKDFSIPVFVPTQAP